MTLQTITRSINQQIAILTEARKEQGGRLYQNSPIYKGIIDRQIILAGQIIELMEKEKASAATPA